jgi:acyl dehydratase
MATTFEDLDAVKSAVGTPLGYSDWHTVTQDQINRFADATGDHQWIHIDPERAAGGPFGTTIAHGYLTLSLLPVLLAEVIDVQSVAMAVNYGLNRVRFPAPVPSGSPLRLGAALDAVEEFPGGLQVTLACVFEVEGAAKPSCVAEAVFRYYA